MKRLKGGLKAQLPYPESDSGLPFESGEIILTTLIAQAVSLRYYFSPLLPQKSERKREQL
jgi:hypothetical protein